MNKLFVHNPLFRLLSPFFSGVIGYLLILLINNNVDQLQEQFFGQELYVCIGLSYIVQEFSRLLLILFKKMDTFTSAFLMLVFQVVASLILSIIIISLAIYLYYQFVLGFTPSFDELLTFVSIFCSITLVYILLHVSHYYLYRVNTKRLRNELLIKENIEEDFKQFKREINPSLLFQSFEYLLILIDENIDIVDTFIDHLASIYRYILASKKDQLKEIDSEFDVLEEFVKLYNHMPYRNINVVNKLSASFLIVPGSLLFIIEQIIKTTIVSTKVVLHIEISDDDNHCVISYKTSDKIIEVFSLRTIEEIVQVYSIYSAQEISIKENNNRRMILVPKLKIETAT